MEGDEHHPLTFDHEHEKTAHDYEEDPFHYNPYHHPTPPKTKAEAEKHLGPEAALFYKEMHDKKPQQQQPKAKDEKSSKKNFVTEYEDLDETPYEHDHPKERHATHKLMHGVEHHPKAHFEQGYWDLKDHVPHLEDEGHFAGEEHGEYHYIEPERTQHLGHYYSYEDDVEHHPQLSDEHHNVHGIEHRPDDWKHDTRTHWVHHDTYRHVPEHTYTGFEHELGIDHHGDRHIGQDFRHDVDAHGYHPGDSYKHDVEYHGGSALSHEVEHEYDELFHEIEQDTKHGVEHHDVHYQTVLPVARDDHPQKGTDFHTTSHFDHHEYVEPAHHQYGNSYQHDVDFHGGAQLKTDVEHAFDELYHEIEAETKYGVEHHDIHSKTYRNSYQHDVDFHGGAQLKTDVEHEYDELYHEIEAETKYGVEHHDIHSETSFLN